MASRSRSNHFSRTRLGTGAAAIKGTIFSTTPLVALPSAPLELSIWLTAGESFSSSSTAPSPASVGSVRAMRSISPTASFRRSMALRVPLHPNALRRKLALKAQVWVVVNPGPSLKLLPNDPRRRQPPSTHPRSRDDLDHALCNGLQFGPGNPCSSKTAFMAAKPLARKTPSLSGSISSRARAQQAPSAQACGQQFYRVVDPGLK